MRLFLQFALALTLSTTALADAASDAKAAAQTFYDGYMALLRSGKDAQKWVLASDQVTPEFKKAYRVYMKEPDADPIIAAQDFPKGGFTVTGASVKGATAVITLSSRDPKFSHTFKATFVLLDGKWRLGRTADIKP